MNLNFIDWAIVATIVSLLFLFAFKTKQYTNSVADFLAANRCAGRYLLTMAEGIAGLGVITIVANFEQFYQAGLAAAWWGAMLSPIMIIISLSGWVCYRYRQTKAMTMGQFFEIRYSKKFRIFAGILGWSAGMLNYAIFPSITARFFIYFCGIPTYTVQAGSLEINVTLGIVMLVFLSTALLFTYLGGQIAIMITDFMQGQLTNIVFLVIMLTLLITFDWSDIIEKLKLAPEGHSMLNPFDQLKVPDFNILFFTIQAFLTFYGFMAWQGTQGYYCSAKSPHEARMARILSSWRGGVCYLTMMLIPVVAYVIINSGHYPEKAEKIMSVLNTLSNSQIMAQLTVPVAITQMLPTGLLGLFCAVMVAAAISTDDTYLHSWGSIFIQDVYLPLKGNITSLSPEKHMKLLKKSILGVAVFAWIFSMIFQLNDFVFMYFALTGAIYIGGAGSVIIGGLYWKRGTTAGAWGGMITGSVTAVTGLILRNIFWPYLLPQIKNTYSELIWVQKLPEAFPYNGMHLSFFAAILSVAVYVIISLLTKPDCDFNMDKMLHRGDYANPDDRIRSPKIKNVFMKYLGITNEFTKTDKFIYLGTMCWTMLWFIVFIIGTIYNLIVKTTDDGWAKWWLFQLSVALVVGVLSVIWFVWGGIIDLKDLILNLKNTKRNIYDDGRVINHHNLSDYQENNQDIDKSPSK